MFGAPPKPAMRPSVAVELLPVEIDLQRRADEHVAGVVAGHLAERAVGAQRAVAPGEEHVRTARRCSPPCRARSRSECTDSTKPASMAGISVGCGLSAQCRQILPLSPSARGVGGQQQLDRGGVEADAVIQALHAVLGVDALDGHHRHQHLDLGDLRRVAREQRLDVVRAAAPARRSRPSRPGMSTRGSRVDELVDLRDDDAARERRGLDDGRRVLGVRAGVEVALRVGRLRRDQAHVRRQVDEVAAEELEVGVDRADLDAARRCTSCASRAACGPENEKSSRVAMPRSKTSRCSGSASTDCTMCRSCTRCGSTRRQRLGQEVGLLLVVAFEADAVARFDHRLQQRDGIGRSTRLPSASGAARAIRAARLRALRSHWRRLGVGTVCSVAEDQSTVAPESLTTFAHFTVSFLMRSAN